MRCSDNSSFAVLGNGYVVYANSARILYKGPVAFRTIPSVYVAGTQNYIDCCGPTSGTISNTVISSGTIASSVMFASGDLSNILIPFPLPNVITVGWACTLWKHNAVGHYIDLIAEF